MLFNDIIWTEKMRAVFRDTAPEIYLCGAMGTSKTLIASLLFFDRIINAPANVNQFAIVGASGVLVKRNFVDKADSLHKIHRGLCTEYSQNNKDGSGSHFCIKGKTGLKIVYLAGADNKSSLTSILSLDLGGILLDEMSWLDIDTVREAHGRVKRLAYPGWIIGTTNGGTPTQEFYTEFVDHAVPQFKETVPQTELDALKGDMPSRHYYHFNLRDDCPHKTPEQTAALIATYPPGSFYYYSKILGCRGFSQGALYAPYISGDLLIENSRINTRALGNVVCSVDMGTSTGMDDTKHAHTIATVVGFTPGYEQVIVLESKIIPSNTLDTVIDEVDKLLLPYWANYYTKLSKIVIDYGDSGGMLVRSWRSRTRLKNVTVKPCIKTGKGGNIGGKEITLQSRAQLKCQLLMDNRLMWAESAEASFKAHKNILSTEDGAELEQSNIDNDYADSLTYTLTENWVKLSKNIY